MKKRVLVLGFDGMTPDLLTKFVAEGKLPHFSKVMNEGAFGELLSTLPPNTSPAWESFYTGKNPGKTGILGFTIKKNGTYEMEVVNSTLIQGSTLWDIITSEGGQVGLLNLPMTYPPHSVNGFMVTGHGTPSHATDYTFPLELRGELDEVCQGYPIDVYKESKKTGELEPILSGQHLIMQRQIKAFHHLYQKYGGDFFMFVISATDKIQHFFWHCSDSEHPAYYNPGVEKFRDAILSIYEVCDNFLGQVLQIIDKEGKNLFIMSDHGGQKNYGNFFINEWLRSKGFLFLKEKPKVTSREHINLILKKLGISWIKRIVPQKIKGVLPVTTASVNMKFFNKPELILDMSKTKVYAVNADGLYFNIKGRDPQGIVDSREVSSLKQEIVSGLSQIRHPGNGKPIHADLLDTRKIYNGPHTTNFPDYLLIFADNQFFIDTRVNIESLFALFGDDYAFPKSGCHRREGIFLAYGSEIMPDKKIEQAAIFDISPTILHHMGLSIPKDMDGKVLMEIFQPRSESSLREIRHREPIPIFRGKTSLPKKDQEEILNQLKALGYL